MLPAPPKDASRPGASFLFFSFLKKKLKSDLATKSKHRMPWRDSCPSYAPHGPGVQPPLAVLHWVLGARQGSWVGWRPSGGGSG